MPCTSGQLQKPKASSSHSLILTLKTVATTAEEWSRCGCGMAMGMWGSGDVWISSLERSGAHEGGLHFVVAAADEGFWLATLKDPFPAHFCRPFCFLLIRIGTLPPYTPPPFTSPICNLFFFAVFVFRLFCGFLRTQANLISFFMPLQRIFKLISTRLCKCRK